MTPPHSRSIFSVASSAALLLPLVLAIIAATAATTVVDASSSSSSPRQILQSLASADNNNDNGSLSFVLDPPVIVETGVATVTWTSPAGFSPSDDWISLWLLPAAKWTYVGYINVSAPTGSHNFTLLNIVGHTYAFRYMRGNSILLETELIQPQRHVPSGPRITFPDDDPTRIRIAWTVDRIVPGSTALQISNAANMSGAVTFFVQPATSSLVHSSLSDQQQQQQHENNKNNKNENNKHLDVARKSKYNSSVAFISHEDVLRRNKLPLDFPLRDKPFDNIGTRGGSNGPRCGYNCYHDTTYAQNWFSQGVWPEVVVGELAPGTRYYYRVGETAGIMSEVFSFVARPKRFLVDGDATRLLFIADAGVGGPDGRFNVKGKNNFGFSWSGGMLDNDPPANGANLVWEALTTNRTFLRKFDAYLFVGDLTYARGWGLAWPLAVEYEGKEVFASLGGCVMKGNHEQSHAWNSQPMDRGGDSGGESGLVVERRFSLPVDPESGGSWYMRTIGNVLIVALDSESLFEPQAKWLREVVGPFIEQHAKLFVVANFHRPSMYQTYTSYHDEYSNAITAAWGDWLTEYAHVVMAGHQHYFTAFGPMTSGAAATEKFRDVWTPYRNLEVAPAGEAQCFLGASTIVSDKFACRRLCNSNSSCTGIQTRSYDFVACQLLQCNVSSGSVPLKYSGGGAEIYALRRKRGLPPRFVNDGTAGAEFSYVDSSNRLNRFVEYQDVNEWGWSEMKATQNTFTFSHFHVGAGDGRPIYEFVINQ